MDPAGACSWVGRRARRPGVGRARARPLRDLPVLFSTGQEVEPLSPPRSARPSRRPAARLPARRLHPRLLGGRATRSRRRRPTSCATAGRPVSKRCGRVRRPARRPGADALLTARRRRDQASACRSVLRPLEVWRYNGSERIRRSSLSSSCPAPRARRAPGASGGRARGSIRCSSGPAPTSDPVERRGGELRARRTASSTRSRRRLDWDSLRLEQAPFLPRTREWLLTFQAPTRPTCPRRRRAARDLDSRFPGRIQSRTVVQALLSVPARRSAARRAGLRRATARCCAATSCSSSFRYRFDGPRPAHGEGPLPLVFQRYLRPGSYTLVLQVEDTASQRFFREEMTLEVPLVERAPPPPAAMVAATTPAAPAPADPRAALAEANHGIATGDQTVKVYAPLRRAADRTRARRGEDQRRRDRPRRFLARRPPVLTKARPPWSVELDLGERRAPTPCAPRRSTPGAELAARRGAAQRRAAPLPRAAGREPAAGELYASGLRAQAEVEVPEGEKLDRVELYLERAPARDALPAAVRAADPPRPSGRSSPTCAPSPTWTTATPPKTWCSSTPRATPSSWTSSSSSSTPRWSTGAARPVEDLAREDFAVYEDGRPQEIVRFERVRDLPIHAGVLLDTSASMVEELEEPRRRRCASSSRSSRPRTAPRCITFADQPRLVVPFTNDSEVLRRRPRGAGGRGRDRALGCVVYALYYFSGLRGKRAIVLLSDGEDSGAGTTFDEALDYARRSGVAHLRHRARLPQRAADARMQARAAGRGDRRPRLLHQRARASSSASTDRSKRSCARSTCSPTSRRAAEPGRLSATSRSKVGPARSSRPRRSAATTLDASTTCLLASRLAAAAGAAGRARPALRGAAARRRRDAAAGEAPRGYVAAAGRAKGRGAGCRAGELVLAADTTVVVDGEILGKPADDADARRMLGATRRPRARGPHRRGGGRRPTAGGAAARRVPRRCAWRALSPERIDWYVGTGEPLDKAGAYAIQGLGALFVEAVRGNYTNVVGLPCRCGGLFDELGIDLLAFRDRLHRGARPMHPERSEGS